MEPVTYSLTTPKGQYVDADEDHLTLYGYHGLDQPLTVAGKEILRQSRSEFLLLRHAVDKAARNTPTPIVIREAVLRELGARTDQNPLWAEDVIYERNRHISVSQAPFFHRSHVGLLSLDSRQLCYVVYETASEADLNPDVKSHSYACIGWSLT